MNSKTIALTTSVVSVVLAVLLIVSESSADLSANERSNLIAIGKTEQIQRQLQVLSSTGSHYLTVAPREYDHFFRDTTVLHPTLLAILDSLDQAFSDLEALPLDESLEHAALAMQWQQFHRDLDEQLGIDPEFPRLEWGARHIETHLPAFIASVNRLHQKLAQTAPIWVFRQHWAVAETPTDTDNIRLSS